MSEAVTAGFMNPNARWRSSPESSQAAMWRFLFPFARFRYTSDSTPEDVVDRLREHFSPGIAASGYNLEFAGRPSADGFYALAPAKIRGDLCPGSFWTFQDVDGTTTVTVRFFPNIKVILLLAVYLGWFGWLGVSAVVAYFRFDLTDDLLVPGVMLPFGWFLTTFLFWATLSTARRKLTDVMDEVL